MTSPGQERDYWARRAERGARGAICSMQPWTDETHAAYLALIEPRLTLGLGPVLDLGCGVGRLTLPLAQRHLGQVFYGLDISASMLALADVKVRQATNIRLFLGNGRDLPFPDLSLGCVFSIIVLQHIPLDGVRAIVREISRCLVVGGGAVLQYVSSGPRSRDFGHVFADEELDAVLDAAGLTRTGRAVGEMFKCWSIVTARKESR